jgi:soluble lytic murein transglycosylase
MAALALPAGLRSQTAPLSSEHSPGAWHTAVRLRPAIQDGTAGTHVVLELARAELELGRADVAYELIEAIGAPALNELGRLPLFAAAAYESGRFEQAALLFQQAAAGAPQPRRGIFTARAADALEQAGLVEAAEVQYEAAASQLTAIAPWLAVRWARVAGDRTRALEVLRRSPPQTQPFAAEAQAGIMLAEGDTAAAIAAFEVAGGVARGALLAAASGDATGARRLGLVALGSADTASVRQGFAVLGDDFQPATAEELVVVVRAHLRLGRRQSALALVREAVDQGEATARTLRILGDLERDVGNFWDAVRAYERAGELGGDDGAQADYRRARLLPSLGRRTEGYRELALFVERYPDHPLAPRGLYLVAEQYRRGGRRQTADSLYGVIASRWPTHEYAGRSRFKLAAQARLRGDDASAAEWYRAEIDAGGDQQKAASYLLARLELETGDSVAAKARWTSLARGDSLGYYGMMARRAAGLPPPLFVPVTDRELTAEARRIIEQVDLLRATRLRDEAEVLVASLLDATGRPALELVDLAEALIVRGWTSEGIRLGWRAASTLTLGDPRVVRVIFPWPMRDLIEAEATAFDADPHLLAGLIRQESSFTPDAISRAGAQGLMQLMPPTAADLARRLGVDWDQQLVVVADANLHLGVAHLTALLRNYDGRLAAAIAAYNAGGRPVSRWLRYPEASDSFLWVERIPYVETRGYVRTVLRNRELYRALYPGRN